MFNVYLFLREAVGAGQREGGGGPYTGSALTAESPMQGLEPMNYEIMIQMNHDL